MSSPADHELVEVQPVRRISPWVRMGRVFVSPTTAWEGLEEQVQWWIPMLILLAVSAGLLLVLYQRAYLPMILEQMDRQVANGQVPAEQLDRIEQIYSSPVTMYITCAAQTLVIALLTFATALFVWFGVGFVLGAKLKYRLALEVVCWANLVTLPSHFLMGALAWSQETMKGIHLGLAALLPVEDTPSKLHVGATVFLDAISPFTAWNLVVVVIACSTLSHAPRRSIAWVLVSLYLAIFAIGGAVSALLTPGS